jgi:DNA (cytosine-5)-methyltransferase 1
MLMRLHSEDLIVDNFAGGGGASYGIEMALGRSPDIAINHDREAVAMHAENHPATRHLCESVWDVDPVEVTDGRPVGLAWFSPDCTHFSKAKGGKPRSKEIRGLAWVVIRWAKTVKPRVICLENVEEFRTWGPLLDDGRPCPKRRGETFVDWWAQLERCGYVVEARELRACDYGAPTTRKRLFVIARCDGEPIVWPEPTHGPGRAEPYRTAAECIEWAVPCPSIFERSRPLAEKTLRRIARGIRRFVIEAGEPFIAPVTHAGDHRVHSIREPVRTVTSAHRGELSLVSPTLIQQSWGERPGQAPRALDLHKPLGTVVAGGIKHALVAAYLAKHYGGNEATGSDLRGPIHTITARDHHALVRAFLIKYYGQSVGTDLGEPMHTVTSRDRFGLVTVAGEDYAIADIGMRMLIARELYRAQGFPDSYRIDLNVGGKPLTKTAQIRMCGNSVPPQFAEALVRANCVEAAVDIEEAASA